MKKIFTCLLAFLGLTTACSQENFETDVFTTKSGKTIKIHALMHASVRLEYDNTSPAKLIKPKVLFPYHYTPADITTIPSQLEGTGIDVRVRKFD